MAAGNDTRSAPTVTSQKPGFVHADVVGEAVLQVDGVVGWHAAERSLHRVPGVRAPLLPIPQAAWNQHRVGLHKHRHGLRRERMEQQCEPEYHDAPSHPPP